MGTSQTREVERLIALVNDVLLGESRGGFAPIMTFLSHLFKTQGAIVWELAPEANLKDESPKGRVFVLAAQTPPDVSAVFSEIPLEKSRVGRAIIENRVQNSKNIWKDPVVYQDYPPLKDAHVWRLLAAPVDVPGGGKGVVSLYATKERRPFTKGDARKLEEYAELIPGLFKAVRDKVNYSLIGKVNDVIKAANPSAGQAIHGEPKVVFQKVCNLLAKAFNCLEATVVMQDVVRDPAKFKVMASTWHGGFRQESYTKNKDDGITGWVLSEKKPVRMPDLCNFERDRESMSKKYPLMSWRDPVGIKKGMEAEIKKSKKAAADSQVKLPPISFVAVPIVVERNTVGVVRCAAIRPTTGYVGPFFFSSYDQELLSVVADQLGQYWSSWLKRKRIHEENQARDKLVEHITELNKIVETRLVRGNFDLHDLFGSILGLVAETIDGADALDIRLYDKEKKDLYFAYTWGEPWKHGDPPGSPVRAPLAARFPIEKTSAGAHVFKTNRLYHIKDVTNRRRATYFEAVFPNAKRIIVAPIAVSDEPIGVLDIHGMGRKPFSPTAEAAALLVGRQIGLYYHLDRAMLDLQDTQLELERSVAGKATLVATQSRTFEDVAHQLRGPLIQARIRGNNALSAKKDKDLFDGLDMVATLVRKALRVTTTMRVLGKLYRDEPIPLQMKTPLRERELIRMLKESAKDNQVVIAPYRKIRFVVDEASFKAAKIDLRGIEVDVALLEQAVNSLLDNAGKYSYNNTVVQLLCRYKKNRKFHITVRSRGFRISKEEAKLCVTRGWRGGRASVVTGEGSGIGLWVVDHIMRAHNGQLIVEPTNDANDTDVKLVFST